METLRHLNWPTLAWRRRLQCPLLFWKLLNHQDLPQLEDLLPPAASDRAPQYAFRKGRNLAFPRCTTQAHNKSFLQAAVALWNDLPAFIQSCTSLHSFRCALSRHFCHDRFFFWSCLIVVLFYYFYPLCCVDLIRRRHSY